MPRGVALDQPEILRLRAEGLTWVQIGARLGATPDGVRNSVDRARQKYVRDHLLNRRYGLSSGDYERLVEAQEGRCAICGRTPEEADFRRRGQVLVLCIDHCHDSGEIRGLLCGHCNSLVGHADDDPAILRAAADYVENAPSDGRRNVAARDREPRTRLLARRPRLPVTGPPGASGREPRRRP